MYSAFFDIYAAMVMVVVGVGLIVWFLRSRAADSARRLMCMISRVDLDPGTATHDDPRTKAILEDAQRRCLRCRVEGFCERWLGGKAEGDNSFCPNARIFRSLS